MLHHTTRLNVLLPESLQHVKDQDIIFIDIETTGLSPRQSRIYMLGYIIYTQNSWQLHQYIAQDRTQESALITLLGSVIVGRHYMISYNGTTFDLPFIKARAAVHQTVLDFSDIHHIDYYRLLRPISHLLPVENMKQATIEVFLGMHRDEPYTAAELIKVYDVYQQTHDESMAALLFEHNKNDLAHLALLAPVLNYNSVSENYFSIQYYQTGSTSMQLYLRLHHAVPVPVTFANEWCRGKYSDDQCQIVLPVYTGVLRYFFPHPGDYYYLPDEDYAIHKRVACYVDASHRVKATPQTCYTKKSGIFLKQPARYVAPVFKEDFNSPALYFEVTPENICVNNNSFLRYLKKITGC